MQQVRNQVLVSVLLAVAVSIALIGVANPLSLSVPERTRESARLRVRSPTRGQVRGRLVPETVLIAGIAALQGIVLDTTYGELGAQSAVARSPRSRYRCRGPSSCWSSGPASWRYWPPRSAPARRAARHTAVEGFVTEQLPEPDPVRAGT